MSKFHYSAYNASGKEVAGSLEARSHKDAKEQLKGEGLFAKELTLAAAAKKRRRSIFSRTRKVGTAELSSATRQLSTLLGSGATLYDSLNILIAEIQSDTFIATLTKVKDEVSAGRTLAGALSEHPIIFPEMYIRMVEAGEESGTLDSVLVRLADFMEVRARISEQVKTALLYPAVVTTVSFGVLGFLLVYVVPKITRIFEDSDVSLPLVTVVLLFVAWGVRTFWPALLVIAGLAFFGYKPALRRPGVKSFVDRSLLKLPYISGVLTTFYSAGLSRTLGSLLSTGVPILRALEMTKNVLNHTVYDVIFEKAEREVTEGAPLSATFKGTKVVPDLMVHMIAIGERSGKLDELLLKAADSYEKEFERSITRALAMLEPALIVFMGGIVGFIVLAILLPIFELNQLIK